MGFEDGLVLLGNVVVESNGHLLKWDLVPDVEALMAGQRG